MSFCPTNFGANTYGCGKTTWTVLCAGTATVGPIPSMLLFSQRFVLGPEPTWISNKVLRSNAVKIRLVNAYDVPLGSETTVRRLEVRESYQTVSLNCRAGIARVVGTVPCSWTASAFPSRGPATFTET